MYVGINETNSRNFATLAVKPFVVTTICAMIGFSAIYWFALICFIGWAQDTDIKTNDLLCYFGGLLFLTLSWIPVIQISPVIKKILKWLE